MLGDSTLKYVSQNLAAHFCRWAGGKLLLEVLVELVRRGDFTVETPEDRECHLWQLAFRIHIQIVDTEVVRRYDRFRSFRQRHHQIVMKLGLHRLHLGDRARQRRVLEVKRSLQFLLAIPVDGSSDACIPLTTADTADVVFQNPSE